jgi:hypothetical protein
MGRQNGQVQVRGEDQDSSGGRFSAGIAEGESIDGFEAYRFDQAARRIEAQNNGETVALIGRTAR